MLRNWRRFQVGLRFSSFCNAPEPSRRTNVRRKVTVFAPRVVLEQHRLLVRALQKFHERHGHFCVPVGLVLPQQNTDDATNGPDSDTNRRELEQELAFWPNDLHGFHFGERFAELLAELRRVKCAIENPKYQMLLEIGFPVNDWDEYEWQHATLPALQTFAKVHGHCVVARSFVVPVDDETWPLKSRGHPLGNRVVWLRRQSSLPKKRRQELEKLGFVWKNVQAFKWHTKLLPQLRLFRKRYGHLSIPKDFEIPSIASWPRAMWGDRLGLAFRGIRDRGDYLNVEGASEELASLDFEPMRRGALWHQKVLLALETYKNLHGDCNVPLDFVVPSHPPWHKWTWGLRFELVADDMACNPEFATQIKAFEQRWQAIEFDVRALIRQRDNQFEYVVVPALQRFEKEFGQVQVPVDFQVPTKVDTTWPEGSHGFALGQAMKRIRLSHIGLPRKIEEQLKEIGFQRPKQFDVRWNEMYLPALEAYASLYGSCERLPSSFLVPDDAPFPPNTWGLDIGFIMTNLLKPRSELYNHPDKLHHLTRLGFTLKRKARVRQGQNGNDDEFFFF